MKLYHLLGRLLSPLALIGFAVHHALFHTPRARVLVKDEADRLLLVQNWLGMRGWGLPGGGVKKDEVAKEAARRELFEETGISMPVDEFHYLTTAYDRYKAPIYSVTIRANQLPKKLHNPWEITAINWFSTENLPDDLSPETIVALKELSKRA